MSLDEVGIIPIWWILLFLLQIHLNFHNLYCNAILYLQKCNFHYLGFACRLFQIYIIVVASFPKQCYQISMMETCCVQFMLLLYNICFYYRNFVSFLQRALARFLYFQTLINDFSWLGWRDCPFSVCTSIHNGMAIGDIELLR